MKGIVFTEFLEMVESRMGMDMQDRIIVAANLPNDGAYTAVGTYDHAELVRLVVALSDASGTPVPALIQFFGGHLFQRFALLYPAFFAGVESAFIFLGRIENYIHVEVRKLYPEAELPSFECDHPTPDSMQLLYSSPRGFGDLAEGLIKGCIAHFGGGIAMTRTDLPALDGKQRVSFDLVRQVA